MARGSEKALIRRYTEPVDLRIGMWYCAGAYPAQGFPESVRIRSQRNNQIRETVKFLFNKLGEVVRLSSSVGIWRFLETWLHFMPL